MASLLPPNAADEAAGPDVETFAGMPGRWFGWFIIGLCALLCAYAATRDAQAEHDTFALAGLIAPITWIVLVRPSVHARLNGVLMRNMLRDTFVPWSRIERCRVLQTLQLVTEDARFHGLGVVRSTRSVVRKQRQAWAAEGGAPPRGPFGLPSFGSHTSAADDVDQPYSVHGQYANSKLTYPDYVEQRIATFAEESEDDGRKPVVAWSLPAVTALAVAIISLAVLIF